MLVQAVEMSSAHQCTRVEPTFLGATGRTRPVFAVGRWSGLARRAKRRSTGRADRPEVRSARCFSRIDYAHPEHWSGTTSGTQFEPTIGAVRLQSLTRFD